MKKAIIIFLSIIISVCCFVFVSCADDFISSEEQSVSSVVEEQSEESGVSGVEEQSGQNSQGSSQRTPVQPITDGGGFQGGDYIK